MPYAFPAPFRPAPFRPPAVLARYREPVVDYVFTQPGIQLAGQRVAEGTAARLVLWHIGGPVRVVGATSNEQLSQKACP